MIILQKSVDNLTVPIMSHMWYCEQACFINMHEVQVCIIDYYVVHGFGDVNFLWFFSCVLAFM